MNEESKSYVKLSIWILTLMFIGSMLGWVTKSNVDTWYRTLVRSSLTPPNYIFRIVWSILYLMIAISGWFIWEKRSCPDIKFIKRLYVAQLIFNWCWTPLFFRYHLTGAAFICLIIIIILVATLIFKTHKDLSGAALLLTPYLLWLLFAGYLNFYIWQYN